MKNLEYFPKDQKVPFLGLNTLTPSDQMDPSFSPDVKNMVFDKFIAEKRGGYTTLGRSLNGTVQDIFDFEDTDGTNHLIAVTTTGIWEFDFTVDEWFLKSKLGSTLVTDYADCEAVSLWTAVGAEVTLADEGTIKQVGTNSMKMTLTAGVEIGDLLAYSDDFSPSVDVSSYSHLTVWIYSTVVIEASGLAFILTEESAGGLGGSGVHAVFTNSNQAIAATTWTRVRMYSVIDGALSSIDAAYSWGIRALKEIEGIIYIDDMRLCSDMNGDISVPIDRQAATDTSDGRLLFVTNGVDIVQYWDGTGYFADISDMDNWSADGIADFVKCDTIALFKDHLFFGNLETTSDNPFTLTWSVAGDFDDFQSSGSGSILLSDAKGEVLKLMNLGDRMAVYTRGSIHLITYQGSIILFSQEKRVDTFNVLSARCIVDLGSFHVALSEDDMYAFDGSRNLIRLSERIHPTIRGLLNLQYASQAYLYHHVVRQRIYIALPTDDEENSIVIMHYDLVNVSKTRWSLFEYNDSPLCMGTYVRNTAIKWDSASIAGLTWAEYATSWEDTEGDQSFPVRILGNSNQVYETDLSLTDNAVSVNGEYSTPDFSSPDFQSFLCRWFEIEIIAQGDTINVSYSGDKGLSFSTAYGSPLTLDPNNMLRYRIQMDKTSRTMRIKFTGSNIKISWVRLWFRPVSER